MSILHRFADSHFQLNGQHQAAEHEARSQHAGEYGVIISLMWIKMKSKSLSHMEVDAAVYPLRSISLVSYKEIS